MQVAADKSDKTFSYIIELIDRISKLVLER